MTQETLRTSPLDALHRSLGARMVPFAGWEMPIQYGGIVEEVKAVRERSGLFDVSHMGRLFLSGPDALTLLRGTFTYDAAAVPELQGHYNLLCNEFGGILDDPYLYHTGADRWLVVGNASRWAADLRWLQGHRQSGMDVTLDDRQTSTTMLALQGPGARHVFSAVFSHELEQSIPRHACHEIELFRYKALVSRTGYTGEDGFEFVCSVEAGQRLWEALIAAGVTPCGLGARDVLRLEASLALYGNDIDVSTSPWEAGLGWVVSLHGERDFEGRQALENGRHGVLRRLVCLRAEERCVPRHGYALRIEGTVAGQLSSGTFSPTLNAGIAMAYLPVGFTEPGTNVEIDVRGRLVPATVVRRPFYRAQP